MIVCACFVLAFALCGRYESVPLISLVVVTAVAAALRGRLRAGQGLQCYWVLLVQLGAQLVFMRYSEYESVAAEPSAARVYFRGYLMGHFAVVASLLHRTWRCVAASNVCALAYAFGLFRQYESLALTLWSVAFVALAVMLTLPQYST